MRKDSRIELHKKLCDLLGSKNVYYQPPESLKINLPAIIYYADTPQEVNANNGVYFLGHRYHVTYLTLDPDSQVVDDILTSFKKIHAETFFKKDNTNHYQFTLYYK